MAVPDFFQKKRAKEGKYYTLSFALLLNRPYSKGGGGAYSITHVHTSHPVLYIPSLKRLVLSYNSQGSHGQGKVSEKWKKFKVREKSGNFELGQGNLKFLKKSGKSQGIL